MMISGHKTRAVFERCNIVSESDPRDAARRLGGLFWLKKTTSPEPRHAIGTQSSPAAVQYSYPGLTIGFYFNLNPEVGASSDEISRAVPLFCTVEIVLSRSWVSGEQAPENASAVGATSGFRFKFGAERGT
jgi:hypothetical protein